MAGHGVRVAEVAQEFPDHEGELRIVEAKAEEGETLADPQLLEGVVVDTRFIRLAVLPGVQHDAGRALPIAVDPEHRAVIVEDVTGAPAIDLVVVLPGRRAGAEALRPQLGAGEFQRGVVVGRDVGAKGHVQQRGVGGGIAPAIRAFARAEGGPQEISVEGLAELSKDDVDALLRVGGRVGLPAFGVLVLGLALGDGMVGKKLDEPPPKRIHPRRSPGTDEGDGLAGLQDGDQRLEHRAVTGDGKDVLDGTTHRFCMA